MGPQPHCACRATRPYYPLQGSRNIPSQAVAGKEFNRFLPCGVCVGEKYNSRYNISGNIGANGRFSANIVILLKYWPGMTEPALWADSVPFQS
jgi:hypothetical protein